MVAVILGDMSGVLEVVANLGTFFAALATIVLVYLTSKTLKALHEQIKVGQDAAAAARRSADAARESATAAEDAVREAAKTRIDDQAPRVVVLLEEPEWPPFIDPTRSGMPGGGERTLLESMGQAQVAGGPYFFDEQKSWFLWFRTRGVLMNEGRGTARVRLDGDARFIESPSPLLENAGIVSVPPKVGVASNREYLLRPGGVAVFEWAYGHTLGEWADARQNMNPPNPNGACFLTVTVFDWLSSGVIDHHYILLQARPIEPVRGRQGQWKVLESPDLEVGLTAFPPQRTYRAWHEDGTYFEPAPWHRIFADWNAAHAPEPAEDTHLAGVPGALKPQLGAR